MKRLPSASVVVPTFNRLSDLQRVVRAVTAQMADLSSTCELIVVDDGSNDGTGPWLDEQAAMDGITVLRQENAGPAKARNRGAAAASGSVVLFLGDDTEPCDGWLLEHLETHRIAGAGDATAVLGYTAFPSTVDSPFLRWINEYGAQFGYALIDDPMRVDFNFFYTSNISLPRVVFDQTGGFREDFPAAAWEDIEFAYRATAAGMRMRYNPRARTVHHHRMDVASFCTRQQTSGGSAAIFARLHPELEAFLGVPCVRGGSSARRVERLLLRAWTAVGELVHGMAGADVYRRLLDGCYLEGLAEGRQAEAATNRSD
ncbi:MAG: glycosyltransferase [Thermoanaerobaculales bacterium]|nr:glycosyltransferase [Thermoanaerobaculales bacterium]